MSYLHPSIEEAICELFIMPLISSVVRRDKVGDCVAHLPKHYRKVLEKATSKDFSDVRDDLIKRLVRAESEIHRLARKDKIIQRIIHKI